uniref:Uncharacterized protein n=1 Tax=Riboviria sp. TaxID=2585031 RepID=A0A8K1U414_9VIRU|nr:MAG: hypothetical protein 2 [Riboviria sp.]
MRFFLYENVKYQIIPSYTVHQLGDIKPQRLNIEFLKPYAIKAKYVTDRGSAFVIWIARSAGSVQPIQSSFKRRISIEVLWYLPFRNRISILHDVEAPHHTGFTRRTSGNRVLMILCMHRQTLQFLLSVTSVTEEGPVESIETNRDLRAFNFFSDNPANCLVKFRPSDTRGSVDGSNVLEAPD